ncbi:MAG: hypothetical protein E7256_11765 [Lachnospiraceae bacterium]|nr:hypothetical protein [Lachnospiraceae bacterium]
MKKWNRRLAIWLVVLMMTGSMALVGCSKSNTDSIQSTEQSKDTTEGAGSSTVTVTLSKEAQSAVDEKLKKYQSQLVATIGENELYMDEMLFYIIYYEAQGDYEDYYNQVYNGIEDYFWDMTNEEGITMREQLKQYALDAAICNVIYADQARKAGYTLSEEEIAANKATVETILSGYTEDQIVQAGLAREALLKSYETLTLSAKYSGQVESELLADINEEEIKAGIRKEDYEEYETEYLFLSTSAYDENMNAVELSEEELSQKYAIMEEAYAMIESGMEFDKVQEKLSKKADVKYSERSFNPSDTMYEDAYVEAAEVLSDGEYSPIVRSNYGYYIVKMIDKASKESYEQAITDAVSAKVEELYDANYDTLLESYPVVINHEVWDAVEMGTFTLRPYEE